MKYKPLNLEKRKYIEIEFRKGVSQNKIAKTSIKLKCKAFFRWALT